MQERTPLDRCEQELEEALAALRPVPAQIDGDATWYRAAAACEPPAGQPLARRRGNRSYWRWRGGGLAAQARLSNCRAASSWCANSKRRPRCRP